ncbi:hypothetical protein ACFWBH_03370 [Streptomyces sp. NPDC059999]|uniref:hypothetical protein n=1 Tax=Streptomyces sp. NPDC059999 TaxID=3347030 RepID=UPI0036CD90E1
MTDQTTEKPGGSAEEYRFKSGTLAVLEGRPMTTWAMTRRLPQLVRRGFQLGWSVDRKAVVLLLACQAV